MAKSGYATITIKGPPPYSETFEGSDKNRTHTRGHLWLKNDDTGFTFTFIIKTVGFVFDDGKNGKADGPIYTGTQPDPTGFHDFNGVFTDVILDDVKYMSLQITISNSDHNKYYYQLNFIDLKTGDGFPTKDPIIVNN